ncbi:unnamed protein product, partial [Ixodes pacificus]
VPAAKLRSREYVTSSSRPRRAGAAPRAVLDVWQEIAQNSLNLNGLSSEMAEYAVETLTINGQNVHVVACNITCGVPWDPRVLVTPSYVRAGVRRTVIDLTFTAGALRLTATPQPDS